MALIKVKVTYLDGRVETAVVPPRVLLDAETHFGGISNENRLKASHYLAWATLRKLGKEAAEYDDWLDLIAEADDISPDAKDEARSEPTPTVPDITGSSD